MIKNTSLGAYNFRYNGIYDEGYFFFQIWTFYNYIAARKFLEVVKE